jgi:large subunit ribosomal protein L9
MEIILLERVARLGNVGDLVKVRDGYARNFLLPQQKALRATAANKEVFESKRAALEAKNAEERNAAEARRSDFNDVVVTVVRQASDDGRLYGSVSVRDIAVALEEAGHKVNRTQIDLSTAIKSLGVYDAVINLHPEVHVDFRVHVARNAESPLPEELLDEEAPKEFSESPHDDDANVATESDEEAA